VRAVLLVGPVCAVVFAIALPRLWDASAVAAQQVAIGASPVAHHLSRHRESGFEIKPPIAIEKILIG